MIGESNIETQSSLERVELWVVYRLNVVRLASVFSLFMVESSGGSCNVFFCQRGNKFMATENEFVSSPGVFTAEMNQAENLSKSLEMRLSWMMRQSQKCCQRKGF